MTPRRQGSRRACINVSRQSSWLRVYRLQQDDNACMVPPILRQKSLDIDALRAHVSSIVAREARRLSGRASSAPGAAPSSGS